VLLEVVFGCLREGKSLQSVNRAQLKTSLRLVLRVDVSGVQNRKMENHANLALIKRKRIV